MIHAWGLGFRLKWPPGWLQAATGNSGKPVLLRVDYDSGHGIGSTKQQFYVMWTDMIAFMRWQFGEPDAQPTGQQQASKK